MGETRTATHEPGTLAAPRRSPWGPPVPLPRATRADRDGPAGPRRVFVSYSRSDAMLVDELTRRLRRHGFETWVDYRDLVPGRSWEPQLEEAIDGADVVLLVHSQRAGTSHYVADEWRRAVERGVPVVLALAEAAPIDPRLADAPWVDLRTRFGRGVDRLIQTIDELPTRSPSTRPATAPVPVRGFRAPIRVWAAMIVSVPIALASLAAVWTIIVPVVLVPLPWRIRRRTFNYTDVRNALLALPFTILLVDTAITGSEEGTDLALTTTGWTALTGIGLWLLIRGGAFRRWVAPSGARPRWRRPMSLSKRTPAPVRYGVDAAPEDGAYAAVVDRALARAGHVRVDDGSHALLLRYVSQYHDVTDLDPQTPTLPIVVAEPDDEMPMQLRRTQWVDLRRGAQRWRLRALARHLDEPMGLFDEIGTPPPHEQHVLPDRVQGLFVTLWIGIATVIGYWALLLTGARGELRELDAASLTIAAAIGFGALAAMLWLSRRLRLRRPGRLRASAVPVIALACLAMTSLVDYDPYLVSEAGAAGIENARLIGTVPFLLLLYFTLVGTKAVRRWVPPRGLDALNAGKAGSTGRHRLRRGS